MNELVRHTATYSPPVASRNFGYIGITVFEAAVGGSDKLVSLVGQLQGLDSVPARADGADYDEAVIINAAMSDAIVLLLRQHRADRTALDQGRADQMAGTRCRGCRRKTWSSAARPSARRWLRSILEWSLDDGGAVVENMGFPYEWELPQGEGKWVPTSLVQQQQMPLLPEWGNKRTFAVPSGATCATPGNPAYSIDPESAFYKEALEVYETVKAATPEQIAIARFWSDDPMLSMTPPGHWVSIALQVAEQANLPLDENVDLLARMGIAMADAFVGCWHEKFEYNLIRPITYIKRAIDPEWEPILNTPPFPEYPSGHSTVSGAMDGVLTAFFGDELHVRGPDRFTRRTQPAHVQELPRGGRRGRHFKALWRHPFPCGDCRWPRAGTLHRGVHQRAQDEEVAHAQHSSSSRVWLPCRSPRRAFAQEVAVPSFVDETASSGITTRYDGDWFYMVGGGVATFDCNADGFADLLLPGGESKAQFYRNASARGGTLKFEAAASGLELDGVAGAYPADIDSDGDHRSHRVARRRECRDARAWRLHVRARQRSVGL